jgi:hypothetical protein
MNFDTREGKRNREHHGEAGPTRGFAYRLWPYCTSALQAPTQRQGTVCLWACLKVGGLKSARRLIIYHCTVRSGFKALWVPKGARKIISARPQKTSHFSLYSSDTLQLQTVYRYPLQKCDYTLYTIKSDLLLARTWNRSQLYLCSHRDLADCKGLLIPPAELGLNSAIFKTMKFLGS